MIVKDTVIGRGGANADLSVDDMRLIVEEALESVPAGSRVLAVISDRTRDDNTPQLFPLSLGCLRRAAPCSSTRSWRRARTSP